MQVVEEAGKLVEIRSELAPVHAEKLSANEFWLHVGPVKIWVTSVSRLRIRYESNGQGVEVEAPKGNVG